ncbi:MamI family restriction endonuclease [Xanthomonas phaseoli]|nr:MamI family restriction endonuclease [Xanthomonas phaseoli]
MTIPTLGSLESSEELIKDLYVDLRKRISVWAAVTKQTAQARMGYIGQHLVSVVTGYPGGRSGARGKDLVLPNDEFAEIKTCYRVDQLGKCNDCGSGVSALELECPSCASANIKRNDDSKWLIGIQHDAEFAEVLKPKHYYLVLFDFTDLRRPDTIRASIWRVDSLSPGFAYCLIDYYKNIKSASKSGAPFNLWPFQLKFELMRPLLIYQSFILPDNTIQTRVFPGHQPAEHYPLSPLTTFSRSQNLTAGKVREFAARLEVELPINASKAVLLKTAQDAITARKLDSDVVVDALARTLYATEIAPHLAGLPASMRQQMAGANLL